jgi:hypothetical protein
MTCPNIVIVSTVIPAKAGIQCLLCIKALDPSFRWGDEHVAAY